MAAINFNSAYQKLHIQEPLSSADAPATVAAQFRPLDPGIVNEAIPAFFIGRNMEGFCPRCQGTDRRNFPARELRGIVCEKE